MIKRLIILMTLFTVALAAGAQITGVVVDAENGDTIFYPSVSYKGHHIAVSGDAHGRYSIERHVGLALTFSAVGYQSKTINIKSGTPAVLNVTLWKAASKVLMLPLITSVNVKITNPETSKIPVVIKTILTKEFHCFGFFLRMTKSMIVINEIPPRMISIMMYEHK